MDTPTNKPEDIKDPFEDSGVTLRIHSPSLEATCVSCEG